MFEEASPVKNTRRVLGMKFIMAISKIDGRGELFFAGGLLLFDDLYYL